MAHSIEYWYDVILTEKQTLSSLSALAPTTYSAANFIADVNNTSDTARWAIDYWAIATAIYEFEVVLDGFNIDLATLIANSAYGQFSWYVSTSKKFQYGDTIVADGLGWKYATITTANQIVSLCAAQQGPGVINIKIAKLTAGVPGPLSTPELNAFKSFWAQVHPPGIRINIINSNPDDLKYYATVYYDPLVLTATGESIKSPGTYPVEDAFNEYLNVFSSENGFNGEFDNMRAVDFMQNAIGVKSVYCDESYARDGSNPYVLFTKRYLPKAGYLKIDVAFPLSSTITYLPNV